MNPFEGVNGSDWIAYAAITIVLFFIARALALWYWRVNERVKLLEGLLKEAQESKELQQRQIALLESIAGAQGPEPAESG